MGRNTQQEEKKKVVERGRETSCLFIVGKWILHQLNFARINVNPRHVLLYLQLHAPSSPTIPFHSIHLNYQKALPNQLEGFKWHVLTMTTITFFEKKISVLYACVSSIGTCIFKNISCK